MSKFCVVARSMALVASNGVVDSMFQLERRLYRCHSRQKVDHSRQVMEGSVFFVLVMT